MVVSLTSSTTNGQPLHDEDLKNVMESCEEAIALEEARNKILHFVESRMNLIAPNVSAVVGTAVASQLIGTAGGLLALSRIPSCNVQVLGQNRKALVGLSSASINPHAGYIFNCDIVKSVSADMKRKAMRLIGGK